MEVNMKSEKKKVNENSSSITYAENISVNLDICDLRADEQFCGFDNDRGTTWIYPVNLPLRSYQFNITEACLFNNTLVVLPTGLGKTFIAAVVMYNIYRWYPMSKLIFMAPTRPLVSQQIEACRKVMPMPISAVTEMTGRQNKAQRKELWQSKRVFFATPQVIQSDINDAEQNFPFSAIKLLVIDEAHKAKGRYAYVNVVQTISGRNPFCRVLALSATPGRRIEDISEIVRNLCISHLEIRGENSKDVIPYTYQKTFKIVPVPLGGELTSIRTEFIEIIDPYVRYLVNNNVLSGNMNNMSRGWMIMEHKRFLNTSVQQPHPNYVKINQNFSMCITLYHALELLEQHGLRVFINFFYTDVEKKEKFFVALNPTLKAFLERLKSKMQPNLISFCDLTSAIEQPISDNSNLNFGHPKFILTKNFLMEHFTKENGSKAIIFCEYRESVMLLYQLLIKEEPIIQPKIFVGLGGTGVIRAVTQKEQIEVMKSFRNGECNTLISTSVAEEGIDVGDVDLIICFDISTKNPTRFTQRIGRTGRQKQGEVIMLATEGREYTVAKEVMNMKDKINENIARSREITSMLYKKSPRLIPPEFHPKCVQTIIAFKDEDIIQKDEKKPKNTANKPTKTIKSKKILGGVRGDIYKVFQKNYFSTQTQADFVNCVNEQNYATKNMNATDHISQSHCKYKNSKTEKLCQFLKEVNKRSASLKHECPNMKNVNFLSILKSEHLSKIGKRYVIEKNITYFQQEFRNIKNKSPNGFAENFRAGFPAIQDIFESSYEFEKFLSKSVIGNRMKSEGYYKKFLNFFYKLRKRKFSEDVESFINKKFEEYNKDFTKLNESFSEAYSELNKSLTKSSEIVSEPEAFEYECLEHFKDESKYMNQWTQNEIKKHSTPFRIKRKENAIPLETVSPVKKQRMLDYYKINNRSPANSKKLKSKIVEENCTALKAVAEMNINSNLQHTESEKELNELKENLLNDDCDDFIVSSSDIVIEKETCNKPLSEDRANISIEESMISVEDILNIVSNKEKCIKNNEINAKTCELDDFDLNDFLDSFSSQEGNNADQFKKLNSPKTIKTFPLNENTNNDKGNITSQPRTPKKHNSVQEIKFSTTEISPSLLNRTINKGSLLFYTQNQNCDRSLKPSIKNEANKCSRGGDNNVKICFEETLIGKGFTKKRRRLIESSDSEDTCISHSVMHPSSVNRTPKSYRRRKKKRCEFLNDEAVVSGDNSSDDDDDDKSIEDNSILQFVVDSPVSEAETTRAIFSQRAKYLQSVRSPNKIQGFNIPRNRNYINASQIYSQPVIEESFSAYKEDSFVVTDEGEHCAEEVSELCPLEVAEALLKAKKKEKRKNMLNNASKKIIARKRLVNLQSSDSSDDI